MIRINLPNRLPSFCYIMSLAFLVGCNVGPDYHRPDVETPVVYKESSSQWKMAAPADMADRGPWWLIFNDPVLNNLEERATSCNQTIAIAQSQHAQALAIIDEAAAGFFPSLAASLGDAKSRTQSVNRSSSNASGVNSKPFNTASLGVQSTWEVDLWGNIRRLVEADEAAAQASEAQVAAIRLSTQAMLAQTYFQLRALDEGQSILEENISSSEKFLRLTKNQYKAGMASQLAVLQADAQLQAIKVQAIDNGVARAQYEHAIAVLTNYPPSNFSITRRPSRLTPPEIPLEIPSVLLERRPDIAQNERLMAQANAQIGVATSAFFPMITLSGSRTFQKKSFVHLLSAPAVAWSLGSQLTQTLFDGGARCAAIEAADAGYHATVATYRQTVLTAFQDVEDNLSTLRILRAEYKAQDAAVISSQKQLKFTMNAYKAGTASSLDVLNASANLFASQRNALSIASRQMVAAVGLIKALGGDYALDCKLQ
jgi:NodT family efflux transporter outer membrane factor (OMF) lipoprotein